MEEILNIELLHYKDFTLTIGRILFVFAVLLANVFLIKIISRIIIKRMTTTRIPDGRVHAVVQLLKYILWIVAVISCLNILNIDITFLIASSAALLVGLGLGMQIIFKDFMSGIVLLIEGTIKVNDIVEIENKIMKVKEISLRTSTVLTRDDNIVIIPNHKFVEEYVINWTHNTAPTRFIIDVGVDYSSDVDLVTKCLLQAVHNNPDIFIGEKYKPFVRFNDFGASALDFQLIFWSHNLFRIESTKSNIRYEITKIFRENDITIPFLQVVLHQNEKNPPPEN
ncbi:MAG TPA: mechanosensitive ion channel [Ignavibacteria bacterium]|nr:mechanosensitive ion channel [Ignavibacteria bacterium]HMR39267.1 mechanosensitive ion channel [Ignavibacteria bacterium]